MAQKARRQEDFVSFCMRAEDIDSNVLNALLPLMCSLDVILSPVEKNNVLLFDKKLYSKKAALLNDSGLVWGIKMDFGLKKNDTFKAFRERLDFACELYPNHIIFPQIEDSSSLPPSSALYSSKDLDFSRGMAFACRTFYTAGRAVPWFNSILKALKINASSFFADFDEWQQCNNCSFITGFVPENESHASIEKMQLNFLEEKFSEKNKRHLFTPVSDIVRLNGAFSRVIQEGEESVLNLSYDPDYLLSPYALDINRFFDNVTMEECRVKVFLKDGDVSIKKDRAD